MFEVLADVMEMENGENKTTVDDEDNDAACKDKESSVCTVSEARDLKLQVSNLI